MLRLIQPKKIKIPVSGVFFTTGSFSPHLMLSTIQTQFLSNRMIIFQLSQNVYTHTQSYQYRVLASQNIIPTVLGLNQGMKNWAV